MIRGEVSAVKALLSPLNVWLHDPAVNEILLNQPGEIFVDKNGTLQRFLMDDYDLVTLNHLFQLMANENNKQLSANYPILSGQLYNGARLQLVIPPVSQYPIFSIRQHQSTLIDFDPYLSEDFFNEAKGVPGSLGAGESNDLLSDADHQLRRLYGQKKWKEFLRQAIKFKKNILISGGTGTGKTTLLRACLSLVPLHERILLLEDAREIQVAHQNHLSLLSRPASSQCQGVSLKDLICCCLRLRPDRIIVGEIRGAEILEFIAACSTGHPGSMTTIHANNPQMAFMRMVRLYKLNNIAAMTDGEIIKNLQSVIDVVIQIQRDGAQRKITSVFFRYAG